MVIMDAIRGAIRSVMRRIAKVLNTITGGKLSPNTITLIGLMGHLLVGYMIAVGLVRWAAVPLVVFGLFDTLDGELARLQKRVSSVGMLLDSVTDRMKEVILYTGIVYFLVHQNLSTFAIWAIVAMGGSLVTTYVNAWGEVVLSNSNIVHTKVNKAFRGGLSFEVRMFLLLVALLSDRLPLFVVVMAFLSWITVFQRLYTVIKRLRAHV